MVNQTNTRCDLMLFGALGDLAIALAPGVMADPGVDISGGPRHGARAHRMLFAYCL